MLVELWEELEITDLVKQVYILVAELVVWVEVERTKPTQPAHEEHMYAQSSGPDFEVPSGPEQPGPERSFPTTDKAPTRLKEVFTRLTRLGGETPETPAVEEI